MILLCWKNPKENNKMAKELKGVTKENTITSDTAGHSLGGSSVNQNSKQPINWFSFQPAPMDITIDPFYMQKLRNIEVIVELALLMQEMEALKQKLSDTAALSVISCTEMPVTDTRSEKYYKSQAQCAEWVFVQRKLISEAKDLRSLKDKVAECYRYLFKADAIMLPVDTYIDMTSSSFIEAEERMKFDAKWLFK